MVFCNFELSFFYPRESRNQFFIIIARQFCVDMISVPWLMIAYPHLQAREVTLCPGYVIMKGRNEVTASIKPDELFNSKSFEVLDPFKMLDIFISIVPGGPT